MEEKVYEVEMMYIQSTSGKDYSVETMGRRSKNVKLNFSNVEGIEINSTRPLEIKNSFIQMNDGETKIWNMRFVYPTNLAIKYMGKIVIEVI
jgi:hypothetical protein